MNIQIKAVVYTAAGIGILGIHSKCMHVIIVSRTMMWLPIYYKAGISVCQTDRFKSLLQSHYSGPCILINNFPLPKSLNFYHVQL